MQISDRGAFQVASEEALVPARYKDTAGIDTWGIGHTHNAGAPDPRKMKYGMPSNIDGAIREAWSLFQRDLKKYTADVTRIMGPMKQHELDGWVGWHFNTGGVFTSSAVRKWRAGDKAGAVATMRQWNKETRRGRKVVNQGLVLRRTRDAELILHGRYSDRKMAVYPASTAGAVIWRPIQSYTYAAWSKEMGLSASPRPVTKGTKAVVIGTGVAAAFTGVAAFFSQIKEFFTWLF